MTVVRLSICVGILLSIGLLALRIVERGKCDRVWIGQFGFSMGVGLGLNCLGMLYQASLGIRLSFSNVALLSTGIIVVLVFLNYLIPQSKARPTRLQPSPAWTWTDFLMAGTVGVCIILVFTDALSQPLLAFDARSIWGMKEKKPLLSTGNLWRRFR